MIHPQLQSKWNKTFPYGIDEGPLWSTIYHGHKLEIRRGTWWYNWRILSDRQQRVITASSRTRYLELAMRNAEKRAESFAEGCVLKEGLLPSELIFGV